VIRINLGSDGLAATRFVVSPLHVAIDLLCHYARSPHLLAKRWRALTTEVLSGNLHLNLLAAAAGRSAYAYVPDFLTPEPTAFDNDIDEELHRVATTGMDRVGYELAVTLSGHPWYDRAPVHVTPRVLLMAVERGEHYTAEELAIQLEQFFDLVLAPHWPRIRKRLEDDIAVRADITAREGFRRMICGLSPVLSWREGGLDIDRSNRKGKTLDIDRSSHNGQTTASAVILAPSVFQSRLGLTVDPAGAPMPRLPLLTYPVIESSSACDQALAEVFGASRARLLAMLDLPRSTDELAESLHLSPGTVSYHLQILYRAGLLHRTRSSRRVLYRRIPGKVSALTP
jgi:DNA-binding transcriptional ArsR family regulator